MLAVAVLALGLFWGPLDRWSREGTARFRLEPGKDIVVKSEQGGPGQMGAPAEVDEPAAKGGGKAKGRER